MIRALAAPPIPARASRQSLIRDTAVAWLVLAICLAATWMLWSTAERESADRESNAFVHHVRDVEQALQHEINMLDDILHGAASLFAAAETVTYTAWHNYTQGLKLNAFHRAVHELGFGEYVTAQTKNVHIQKVRGEGLISYRIWPEGERSEFVPVRHIEYVIETKSATAHGYDMLSEPRRRAAIVAAGSTGDTTITQSLAPAIAPADRDPLLLMYRPVYRTGVPLGSAAERSAAIRGYVYLGLSPGKLIDAALHEKKSTLRMSVRDGADPANADRIYDSAAAAAPSLSRDSSLKVGGRTWILRFEALPQFRNTVDHDKPRIILAAGLLTSVLLFVITWFLKNAHVGAVKLANSMTAALREQEALTRSIVDTAVDAIIIIDEHGSIRSFNQAAEHIFGYAAAETIGRNVRLLMPAPYREQHDGYISRYLTTGEQKIIGIGREVTGLRKNGEQFPMELDVSEAALHGRRAFTGIVRDITERKRADQKIIKLNNDLLQRALELTEANKELEAFSYSVSHDLRAPLRHIMGYIGLAMDQPGMLDEETRRQLSIVSASAQRMNTLIDDLLDFSRMNRVELQKTDADLGAIVDDVILELRPECEDRQITWQIGRLPRVYGDPAMLNAVLTNLIANAVKFTRPRPQAVIEIGTAHDDGNETTTVFVRDNGAGFNMRYADKLFGVFQRLHSQHDFEGTGIGLASVHRIVTRHGGRVWAEAEPDKGATFYFSLPDKPQDGK